MDIKSKYSLISEFLVHFLQNEVKKTGLEKVVLGLSGGLDSAIVAVLAKKAFNNNMLCVLMPSQFSSQESIDDALLLCKTFNLPYEIISIKPFLDAYIKENMGSYRIGNLSSRMRMNILYDLSARENALVLGTSNKSELMLGYGTIFGDLASAINPIGDMYKSDAFDFARFLKINDKIVNKPPSADLYVGQSDESDLGYTYSQIDAVLKRYVEDRATKRELIEEKFNENLTELLLKRIYQNQFKRKQPVIAKLTNRTINHDFLYPRDINL